MKDFINKVFDLVRWANYVPSQHQDLLCSFDIQNYFHSVPWEYVNEALRHRGVLCYLEKTLRFYMERHTLTIRTSDGISTIRLVTMGEGVHRDRSLILRCEMFPMTTSIGWKYRKEFSSPLDAIDVWMGDHGFQLPRYKTEAICD